VTVLVTRARVSFEVVPRARALRVVLLLSCLVSFGSTCMMPHGTLRALRRGSSLQWGFCGILGDVVFTCVQYSEPNEL
jgi:hypothetical protein